jgi:putative ABC transport system permease protein
MGILLQDLRTAFRGLRRTPGFAVVVLLTVGLGTGANATVFSFVNALLFKAPPGVTRPGSLVSVYTSDFSSGPFGDSSYPDFLAFRDDVTAFALVGAVEDQPVAVMTAGSLIERVRVASVSGDFFAVLQMTPAAGRLIAAGDTAASAPPVAVIGHRLWQTAFASNPQAVGSLIAINGQPFTVAGVAPPRFTGVGFGPVPEVWTPLVDHAVTPVERGSRGLTVVGRLRAGVDLPEAQAQLDALSARLSAAYPSSNRGTQAQPDRPRPMVVTSFSRLGPQFWPQVALIGAVLLGATGLVLLVVCANVASLMLARATARSREIAIRFALGASRARLTRQLLTESVAISVAGGAVGLLLAMWTSDALPSFFPPELAAMLDARVDWSVFAFTATVAAAAGALFGLAPILHARRTAARISLRTDTGGIVDARSGARARSVLVVMQVALSCILIVATGLLVRGLKSALRSDLGVEGHDLVVSYVETPEGAMSPEQGQAFFASALSRVRQIPGVQAGAWVKSLPLGNFSRRAFRIEGYEPRPGEGMELNLNVVSSEYFETMGVAVVAGRGFSEADTAGSTPVVIVNEELARYYFSGRALGRHLRDSRGRALEIVGVVRSAKYRNVLEAPLPVVYYPLAQDFTSEMTLMTRTGGDPAGLVDPIRAELQRTDARVAVFRATTFAAYLDEVFAAERLTTALVAVCGGMAVLLAMVGVYGVIAYAIVRRTREIGLRVALGARPAQVTRLFAAEGVKLTMIGIVVGLAGAAAVTSTLESMLYGISRLDATAFATAPAVLALTAGLAALLPLRRALRVDPIVVLRQE